MLMLCSEDTFNIMRTRVNLPAQQFCETFAVLLERATACASAHLGPRPSDPLGSLGAPRPRPIYSVYYSPPQGAHGAVGVVCTTEDLFESALTFLHERHPDDRPLRRRVLGMLLDAGYAPDRSGLLWIMRHGAWFGSHIAGYIP